MKKEIIKSFNIPQRKDVSPFFTLIKQASHLTDGQAIHATCKSYKEAGSVYAYLNNYKHNHRLPLVITKRKENIYISIQPKDTP